VLFFIERRKIKKLQGIKKIASIGPFNENYTQAEMLDQKVKISKDTKFCFVK